jgi:hypothetical protein
VSMPVEKQAQAAIVTLHGSVLAGKAIVVTKFSSSGSNGYNFIQ